MKKIKKIFFAFVMLIAFTFICLLSSNAIESNDTDEVFESLLTKDVSEEENKGNVIYPNNVTSEMAKSDFWKKLITDKHKLLMSKEEIRDLNESIVIGSGTNVFNLEQIKNPIKAGVDSFMKNGALRQLYINGEPINQQEYLDKYSDAISKSTFPDGTLRGTKIYYAIVTKRADIKTWPTDEVVGYSESDPDDELELYALTVNEPVVIRDVCQVDGKVFYYCINEVVSGWINSDCLAICESKEQWLDAWKYDINDTNILVVAQDKITLEPSLQVPSTSEVQLSLGTVLKLVPKNDLPQNIGERGTWFNYVVYLPTRDENGMYERQYALISERYNVSVGFMDLTEENILDVAFTCLGNRYGWGGMLGAMDCSMYVRSIYKCFGLILPRNTTWQQKVPGKLITFENMSDEKKSQIISRMPVGSLLYFPGHTTVYTGTLNDINYVISDTGSLSDSNGDLAVKSMYTVILNPLTVRRGNGKTWLNQINAALVFDDLKEIDNNTENNENTNQQDEESKNQNNQSQTTDKPTNNNEQMNPSNNEQQNNSYNNEQNINPTNNTNSENEVNNNNDNKNQYTDNKQENSPSNSTNQNSNNSYSSNTSNESINVLKNELSNLSNSINKTNSNNSVKKTSNLSSDISNTNNTVKDSTISNKKLPYTGDKNNKTLFWTISAIVGSSIIWSFVLINKTNNE